MAGVPKKVIITVNGVPFKELTEDHQQKIIERNTDIAERIISGHVINMIEKGKSMEEIKDFLNLNW